MMNKDANLEEIDLQELIDFGYLQEANRQFFHLLGMALFVDSVGEGDSESLVLGIYDFRGEPEGTFYDSIDREKSERVFAEFQRRAAHRKRLLRGKGPSQPLDVKITMDQIAEYRRSQQKPDNVLNK